MTYWRESTLQAVLSHKGLLVVFCWIVVAQAEFGRVFCKRCHSHDETELPGSPAGLPVTRPLLLSLTLQPQGPGPSLMHFPGSECVLFIRKTESLFLSAQDSGGAWLLHVKGDKSFQEEADRLGGE